LGKPSSTSRLASLYRYVQGVPLGGSLTLPAVASALLSAALFTHLSRNLLTLPLAASCLFLLIALNNWVGRLRVGLLNFRRLNGMLFLDLLILLVGGLLSLPLPSPFSEALLSAFAALAAALRVSITRVLSGKRTWSGLGFSIGVILLEAAPIAILSLNPLLGLGLAVGYAVGAASALISTTLLNKFYVIRGLKPLLLLSGMLAIFLDGIKEWLEELAESLTDVDEIRVDVFLFREPGSLKPTLALIIPDFHPGPFRDFGSSGLPYLIAEKLREKGVSTVIIRGLSNHTKNIISSKDCERIAEKIVEAAESSGGFNSLGGTPQQLSYRDAKALLLPIGSAKLLLLTLHPKGMEDIPPEIYNGVSSDNLIPVDAHNSFSDNIKELGGEQLNQLSRLIHIASTLDPEPLDGIRVGYGWSEVEGFGLEEGIGPLGVSALVFDLGGRLTALIVLDGNNALPEVRSRVLEEARSLGVSEAEVLTTDTHLVNGVKLGGRGYHPLGEVIPSEVLAKYSREAISKALRSLKPMEVKRVKLLFPQVRVMSDDFLSEASEKTFKSLRLFLAALAAAFLSASALTLFLAWG